MSLVLEGFSFPAQVTDLGWRIVPASFPERGPCYNNYSGNFSIRRDRQVMKYVKLSLKDGPARRLFIVRQRTSCLIWAELVYINQKAIKRHHILNVGII